MGVWGRVQEAIGADTRARNKKQESGAWIQEPESGSRNQEPGTRNQDMWAWVELSAQSILRGTMIGGEVQKDGMFATQREMEEYG